MLSDLSILVKGPKNVINCISVNCLTAIPWTPPTKRKEAQKEIMKNTKDM